ncbi:triphosphoribosyl-dephospho-CoA synthase MdcB [Ramlibacter alkalitolerans]|uniref:Probable 2-(5''-triphosphoribosyl)-3'-dephosphocoenzyme-A synthase n=1 Tax=Ramlibacter alkalitolerans TaxID=2039631 RepID=A0ABS1JM44_9BURK|nr:triphosphoribosyl-dephospho-CoA synthase MdcB [Ramlibacter alkalitolerans]MBL0425314.1 triphosphoribosyl-dephospho-CoA synthase MdcB [Ramlibacter alkalitolerans]
MNAAVRVAIHGLPAAARVPLHETVRGIGRLATLALYHELSLAPKPGLVSFVDNGSHEDMDAATFMRSLFGLRSYFPAIAQAGAEGASFPELERLGREAEERMLAATGGINTHRGAIFALGLLCAATGRLAARAAVLEPEAVRACLDEEWGDALRARAARAAAAPAASKGQRAARAHGLRSAGDEAAAGFPVLFSTTLPAMRAARSAGACGTAALVQGLFATLATLDDTNLVHRGGIEGLRFAQAQAQDFLAAGGVLRRGWRTSAQEVHGRFVARRLSPGGAADVIACAWWAEQLGTLASHRA